MKDLCGKHFDRWTVLRYAGNSMWECVCSCELQTVKKVRTYNLTSGHSKSCGCLQREAIRNVSKKPFNAHVVENGCLKVFGENGNFFICDVDDYPAIKKYHWYQNNDGYWACGQGRSGCLLHRLIMGVQSATQFVDHANHNKNDNRKSNLRICTSKENNQNAKRQKRNNSGVIGVRWNAGKNKWTAQIGVDYKIRYLGTFADKEQAIKARLSAEKELFGEYAPQRYMFEKYLV